MKNLSFLVFGLVLSASAYSAEWSAESLKFESKGMKLERQLMAVNSGQIWSLAALPEGDLLANFKNGDMKIFRTVSKKWEVVNGVPKVAVHGQGGLLDVVLAPDFAKSKKIFISYAKEVKKNDYSTALATAELDGLTLKNLKEIFVATGSSDKGEHFGGRIVVDSDSSIFFTVGERGDRNNAQKLDTHFGKILRIDANGKAHPENPFIGQKDKLAEIYSYGHRNPQGLARHPVTKELWEHEHGPRGGDEINIVQKGLNYAWPVATFGKEYYGPDIGDEHVKGMEDPLFQWTPSIAPCGLVIYNGDALPGWKGMLLTGALAKAHFNITEFKGKKMVAEERLFVKDSERVREIEEGPKGEIWYSTDTGNLYRITKV